MSGRLYNFQMLTEISHINAPLALRKEGEEAGVFRLASDFTDQANAFIKKYGDEEIFENHKDFLEDIGKLRTIVEKLFATALIWDIEDLVAAFKTGVRDNISEKLENFIILAETLIKRFDCAECDESGILKRPLSASALEEDKELSAQPECGKTVSGNYAPVERFEKIERLVDELDFDEATRLAKREAAIYYNEAINIELKKLIWVMRLGEFEFAGDSAKRIIEMAGEHNKTVDENIEVKKPRVLVVDDVVDMLLTIKGILCDFCHVCTVTNHISAFRFLENCHADAILLDIGLPEVDGFELLKRIRQIERYKNTPVLFVTGDVSKDTIRKAIDAGISDYLRKPIDAEMLISRIKKYVK